jgi:carboxylate-amine ligase
MDAAIPAVNFGASDDFALGVEEELILVDRATHALEHSAVEVLGRLDVPPEEGAALPEAFAALIELTTPVSADAGEAVASLSGLRRHLHSVGATTIGAGLHPDGAFGDVIHYPSERYRLIGDEMRGLMMRTPTAALHVHIGMPDSDVAIRAYNGFGAAALLQALAANSPFWHGRDSGLATARLQVFRGLPRSEIPASFASFDEYVESVEALRPPVSCPTTRSSGGTSACTRCSGRWRCGRWTASRHFPTWRPSPGSCTRSRGARPRSTGRGSTATR